MYKRFQDRNENNFKQDIEEKIPPYNLQIKFQKG